MIFLRRGILVLLGVVVLAGCGESATGPEAFAPVTWVDGTLFLAQPRVPNAFMEALFQGAILRDDVGCLRLQRPSRATVIWPHGSYLEEREGEDWVVTESGPTIGPVGSTFRLGGGEVPMLNEAMGFSRAEMRIIEVRCPGRYWVVGEVFDP